MIQQIFRYGTVGLSLALMIGGFMMLASPAGGGNGDQDFHYDENLHLDPAQAADFMTEAERFAKPQFDAPVLKSLQQSDLALPDSFTVIFELRLPALPHDPGQGTAIKECRLTYKDGVTALSSVTIHEGEFSYSRPAEGNDYQQFDYDEDQNLLVWQSIRKDSLSDVDINLAVDQQELRKISPTGIVTSDHVYTQVYKYPIGSEDCIPEFTELRLATGHGFSRHLEAISAEPDDMSDQLIKFVARGRFGERGLKGTWNLAIKNSESQIMREAVFFADNVPERPTIRVETFGAEIEIAGVQFAPAGLIEYFQDSNRTYLVELNVLEVFDIADEAHLAEVRRRVTSEIPLGSEIVDFMIETPKRYKYDGTNLY